MSEVKTNKISPSSGTTLTLGNSGDTVTGAGGLASVQVFTTLGSQTWTRPTGVTRVMVEVQGAGGSGGKRNSNGAAMGGGGGGGYARKFIDVTSIASATVVVGTGGPSQTSNDTDGTTGGDSSCLLYTSPSPRDRQKSRMPSSA